MAERTCIATGQNLPACKLIRFVLAPEGVAVAELVAVCLGAVHGYWQTMLLFA